MKKMKKVLALGACAVMLVTASVMGTLAYLTNTASITNSFTVGKVSFGDGTANSALTEAKVNEYGEKVLTEGKETRVVANTYKLIPNHEYSKDPTVHIGENSEASYVYVTVANGISEIEADSVDGGYQDIEDQMLANKWVKLKDNEANEIKLNDLNVYVYDTIGNSYAGTTVKGKTGNEGDKGTVDLVIFEKFKIIKDINAENEKDGEGNITKKGLESYKDKNIVINAYAVQADGFANAYDAWRNTFGE